MKKIQIGQSALSAIDQEASPDALLSGLHAKLFICEQRQQADVWTGSANATSAAFQRNVEFLVQMSGNRSQVGIDKFLASAKDGQVGFKDLLVLYNRGQTPWKAIRK